MACLVSLTTRNLRPPFVRIVEIYLKRNISKVPTRQKSHYQASKILHTVYWENCNGLALHRHWKIRPLFKRHFQTSGIRFEIVTLKVPPFPDSVSEGDLRWQKKVGDAVKKDEVIAEVETDKTALPIMSPGNGVLKEITIPDGSTVQANQTVGNIDLSATAGKPQATPVAAVPPPKPAAPAPPKPAAAPQPPRPTAAPPKPAMVPPAPATPKATTAVPAGQAVVKMPPKDPTKEITGTRTEHRVKMNRMRQKIAQRLKEAQNINAMLTTFNEIDMSHIIEFRKSNLEAFQKKYGIKLGFMSAFLKASAYALQEQPVVNGVIDPTGSEIIYRDYVDISVAVATPRGLVVPVLRNVESMNYADIELALNALGEKARKGAITVEDMDGGTFTVSNGGVFGSLMGTPIINPPQSAILGMHGTFERPVAIKGQVVIRPMMYIALTYDHRLVDGREAVLFLRKIKAAVEDPRIMIAGL
ncbi:hypothetical protein FQA39_LY08312 [Lamprigera yunnana]|nr:hypothetical protein FQA39_LY08312 [Lamprigera yunnana]